MNLQAHHVLSTKLAEIISGMDVQDPILAGLHKGLAHDLVKPCQNDVVSSKSIYDRKTLSVKSSSRCLSFIARRKLSSHDPFNLKNLYSVRVCSFYHLRTFMVADEPLNLYSLKNA